MKLEKNFLTGFCFSRESSNFYNVDKSEHLQQQKPYNFLFYFNFYFSFGSVEVVVVVN